MDLPLVWQSVFFLIKIYFGEKKKISVNNIVSAIDFVFKKGTYFLPQYAAFSSSLKPWRIIYVYALTGI